MAEESPQNINPATDPQVEDPPSTAVPLADVDRAPAPVVAATNPEVPQPTQQAELPTAPQPDEAFLEQQTAQENRWIQAAATNPEGIRDNGSVEIDKGGGVRETINRDGSYEISSGEGTYRYDAAGQQTSYTSPNINGLSVTTTADGVQVTRFSQGPLTTTEITKDGQPISTTTSFQFAGGPLVTETQVAGGEIVRSASTIEPSDDPMSAGTLVTATQVGEGEIITSTTTLQGRIQAREAALEANAENIKLREDLIAAKQQTESGIPLSATQQAALEEQAQAAAAADAELAAAELAVAETDPTVVAPDTNPQVAEPADQDPIPSLATTEVEPLPVTGDTEVNEFVAQQEAAEFVPASEIDTGPAPLSAQEIQEYEQLTAVNVNEIGAQFQEPFVSEEARAAAGEFYAANPETIREIINSPPPPPIETQQEEIDLSLEELESRVAAGDEPPVVTEDPEINEFVAAEEAAEFVPLSAIEEEPFVPDEDAEVNEFVAAEEAAEFVPVADIDTDPAEVLPEDDPTVPEPDTPPEGGFYGEPTPVGGNFTASYDPETGTYDVVDLDTGEVVETGLSQQQATLAAQDLSLGDPQFPNETDQLVPSNLISEPTDVDVAEAAFVETDTGFFELQEEAAPQPDEFGFVEADDGFFVTQDEIEAQIDQEQFEGETDPEEFVPLSEIEDEPEPVDSPYEDEEEGTIVDLNTGERVTAGQAQADAAIAQAALDTARAQQSVREQRGNSVDSADWRVRLRLAPRAYYLYKADEAGILTPLQVSDGIIFPYTPTVSTVYKAQYDSKALTHSNYRGLFYQSSYVEDINITGVFTAQDTVEAEYLLAVIHFFRSATKMFYGDDPQRGAPPPLVFLSAYGAYQYVDAPCVISSFNYNLPADVDYIRARAPNIDGTNLLKRRDRQSLPTNAFDAALQRLKNARPGGLPPGAQINKPPPPSLGLSSPTYVPTRMEITIVLHPVQTRKQVSQQFSVKEFAPGRLQSKGFW